MFRHTDPQATFGSLDVQLPAKKLAYLQNQHWSGAFREKALPILLAHEKEFAPLFCADNGRPNKPVATVLGVLILKEMFDLTDEEALERFAFDASWQYALNVEPDSAWLCQKTLHNFRVRLTEAEARGDFSYSALFDAIVRTIVEDLGLNVGQQRLDSTHIRSNMAVLSRLGLFVYFITAFLKKLQKQHPRLFAALPAGIVKRYIEREGYFADSPSSQARRRLEQCAADLWRLVDRFAGHRKVSGMPSYRRLVRMLKEQCVVADAAPSDPDGDGPEGVPVRAKEPPVEKIPATSLQGSDADATYGHKGKGYQAQVGETCHSANPVQVVTHVAVEGAHESDQHATVPVIDALDEKGCKPSELQGDTNYGSGQNIVEAAERDVELITPACGSEPERIEGEVNRDDFAFSPDGQRVERCPQGHAPVEQGACGPNGERRYARMDIRHCADCPFLDSCPARWNDGDETMTFTWSPAEGATSARRQAQQTSAFKEKYRRRSGIEATNSEFKRRYGGGRLRVRGHPAVDRTVKFKFMALNIRRWIRAARQTAKPAA